MNKVWKKLCETPSGLFIIIYYLKSENLQLATIRWAFEYVIVMNIIFSFIAMLKDSVFSSDIICED